MALCELSEQPGNLCDQIFVQESQGGPLHMQPIKD